jgi:Right handed beta helix region
LTINRGVKALAPGDTLYLNPGVCAEELRNPPPSGRSASQPTKMTGPAANRPIIGEDHLWRRPFVGARTMQEPMMKRFFWILAMMVCWPISGYTADRYMATTGNDNTGNGTIRSPYRTFAKCISGPVNGVADTLGPGETCWVKGGTYFDAPRHNIPSGTSWSNMVAIAGMPGETVIIQSQNPGVNLRSPQKYILLKNLILDQTGLAAGCVRTPDNTATCADFVKLEDVTVRNGWGTSVVGPGNDWWLNRFTCHTTNVSPPAPANAVSLENHCIYASSDRVLIENSEFYHNGNGYALQIKGKDDGSGSQPDHWIIRNTRFHDDIGPLFLRGTGHKIYNNVFYRIGCAPIRVHSANSLIAHNTFFATRNFALGAPYPRCHHGQCSAGKTHGECGSTKTFGDVSATNRTITIVNNVVYQSGYGSRAFKGGTQSNNYMAGNPLFVDVHKDNYHLTADSPARGACPRISDISEDMDGDPRPASGNVDCGADQYVTPLPPPKTGTRAR